MTRAAPHRRLDPETRAGLAYCVKVFLVVRIGLLVLGYVATGILPDRAAVSVPGWPDDSNTPGLHNVVTSFEEQDALWYLRIADGGYRAGDGSAAFFPLFPLAVRGTSWASGGRPLAAGLLVSNLAFLGAICVLYLLTRTELSESKARKAVLYISIFPTSFFFFAPYGESLFLLLAVTAFWAARRTRWPVAGASGALAAATRSVGVILAPALAVEALHQWREKRGSPWMVAWAAVVPLGLGAYLWYWQRKTGDALAPLRFQSNWQREAVFAPATLLSATAGAFRDGGFLLLDWLVVAPALAAAAYGVIRFRPAFSVFTWLGILVPLSFIWPDRPLMSMPRFVLPLFPIFWALAELAERRRIPHTLIVGVSAAGLGVLTVLFVDAHFIF